MNWSIVYKGKASRGSLTANLEKAGIPYFIPMQIVEELDGNCLRAREQVVFNNLIFIQTDQDIRDVVRRVDGLRKPYFDSATQQPAIVSDQDMQRFRNILLAKSLKAKVLQDPISRFHVCQRVRVKAGDFEGTEGYVFRIRGNRELVIALGDMAVAISGIHHTLLEPIDE